MNGLASAGSAQKEPVQPGQGTTKTDARRGREVETIVGAEVRGHRGRKVGWLPVAT